MERTIKVDGKSNLSIKPDKTCITLTLKGKNKLYQEVLKASTNDLMIVVKALMEIGFSREDLKTSYFTINQTKDGHYEQNKYIIDFEGFEYIQNLKLEFSNNNETINKVLVALSKISIDVEIAINYFIGDVSSIDEELEALAIKAATSKAMFLTTTLGVRLGKIISIECLSDENVFSTNNVMMLSSANRKKGVETGFNVDMEPDNIKLTKSIKLVYEIE